MNPFTNKSTIQLDDSSEIIQNEFNKKSNNDKIKYSNKNLYFFSSNIFSIIITFSITYLYFIYYKNDVQISKTNKTQDPKDKNLKTENVKPEDLKKNIIEELTILYDKEKKQLPTLSFRRDHKTNNEDKILNITYPKIFKLINIKEENITAKIFNSLNYLSSLLNNTDSKIHENNKNIDNKIHENNKMSYILYYILLKDEQLKKIETKKKKSEEKEPKEKTTDEINNIISVQIANLIHEITQQ